MDVKLLHLEVGSGVAARQIAVRRQAGRSPGLFWLGGLKSDMRGTKAEALADYTAQSGRAFVRFDYSGHGESGGRFEDGTITRWLEEAAAVFDQHTRGSQVIVGSSMGGWIALLMARALAKAGDTRLAGLVLIAPAWDMTEKLMWEKMSPKTRAIVETEGVYYAPSNYDAPYPLTKILIEEGRNHLVADGGIAVNAPVRILQGLRDPDVPWQHALALVDLIASDDVEMTLVKDGDHRLSGPEDLRRLERVVAALIESDGPVRE